METMINLVMLVCAIAASLAFGVLSAHALCRSAFALLKLHASSVTNSKLEKVAEAS